jgi:hypothetical protein
MTKVRELLKRFWSLALVLCLSGVELLAEKSSAYPDQETTRAVLSVVGITLVVHSWIMQRKSLRSNWRLTFWTLFLTFFALEFLWLGLNSIRGATYPNEPNADNRAYWFAVVWQDRIVLLAKVVAGIVGTWIVIDIIGWTRRRLRDAEEEKASPARS